MSWLGVAIGLGIAVVFLTLVFLILWLFPDDSRRSTVPGMEPSSNINGNLDDLNKAGGVHDFLVGLHKEYGPVASFWYGTQYTVSVCNEEYFKQQLQMFDRPVDLFYSFDPIVSQDSIMFANGKEGKARRVAFDKVFSFDSLHVYYSILQQAADEVCRKWRKADDDDHFPLTEHMSTFSTKAALSALMAHSATEKEVWAFRQNFEAVWEEMEKRYSDPLILTANSVRAINFLKSMMGMKDVVGVALKTRQVRGTQTGESQLADVVIGYHGDEEKRINDAMTYVMWALPATGSLLTWCIYYLATHEDAQEKLYAEISTVLGPKDPVTQDNLGKLKYLRQVLDETLRCAMVTPFTARCSEEDTQLGGHKIPSGTPVIHALGVAMMDEAVWPAPTVFDPDRFSEKRSKGRPSIVFSPFGFAGRRQCPAYRFAYLEASVMLVTAIQKFKVMLVPGQQVKPMHGLVTRPKEEIWFKVAQRV